MRQFLVSFRPTIDSESTVSVNTRINSHTTINRQEQSHSVLKRETPITGRLCLMQMQPGGKFTYRSFNSVLNSICTPAEYVFNCRGMRVGGQLPSKGLVIDSQRSADATALMREQKKNTTEQLTGH